MFTLVSPKRVPSLHFVVATLTATTGFVGLWYVWLRQKGGRGGGSRSNNTKYNDDDNHRPPNNETEQLYSTYRQGLRRVGVIPKSNNVAADRYRDIGLQRHIQACQVTKQKLRPVTDPDQVRKQNLQAIKLKKSRRPGKDHWVYHLINWSTFDRVCGMCLITTATATPFPRCKKFKTDWWFGGPRRYHILSTMTILFNAHSKLQVASEKYTISRSDIIPHVVALHSFVAFPFFFWLKLRYYAAFAGRITWTCKSRIEFKTITPMVLHLRQSGGIAWPIDHLQRHLLSHL